MNPDQPIPGATYLGQLGSYHVWVDRSAATHLNAKYDAFLLLDVTADPIGFLWSAYRDPDVPDLDWDLVDNLIALLP